MQHFDFCILGAGLAGLSFAKAIVDQTDFRVVIIDPNGVGGGASGTPVGLANPATGRFANKSWKAEQSLGILEKNFLDVKAFSKKEFYLKTGVVRPAMDARIARRMKENWENTSWPDGWFSWLSEDEINSRFPGLSCTDGGVIVQQAYTVDVPEYLNAITKYLKGKHVHFVTDGDYKFKSAIPSNEDSAMNWEIQTEDERISVTRLVFTSGIKTRDFKIWNKLPLHPVKGQIALFNLKKPFPYSCSVSALGYFTSLYPNEFVAGSTYEHDFEHEQPDEQGLSFITQRLFRVIPEMEESIEFRSQWSNVRASTPDRMPIIGEHPEINNCFVIAGLGSKGLLYSSLLADELLKHIVSEVPISKEVSIRRFL